MWWWEAESLLQDRMAELSFEGSRVLPGGKSHCRPKTCHVRRQDPFMKETEAGGQ